MKQARLWLWTSLTVAVVAPAWAMSPQNQQWEQEYRQRVVLHAQQLAARGGAEDLYLAVMLTAGVGIDPTTVGQASELKGMREQWLERALAAPGNSLIVSRAALAHCKTDTACEQARAHWQALGVDDAGAWLLPGASGEIDEAAWAAAATSGRYLSNFEVELPALLRASADWEPPAPPARIAGLTPDVPVSGRDMLAVMAVATLAATQDIPVKAINQCRAAADSPRQQQCRAIFAVMADSPTLVQASLGTSIRAGLATDPADQRHWQQRQRELAWVVEQGVALLNEQPAHAFLQQACAKGERVAWQELLAQADIAPQPPADWQPNSPEVAGR